MDYRAKEKYQDSQVAGTYDEKRFTTWYGRMAHEREAERLGWALDRYCPESGKVLDLPCGTGRLMRVLTERRMTVLGGDISEEMLRIARKKFIETPKVDFQVMDAERLPFEDGHFDYLTSYRLMTHLPGPVRSRVLKEMIRVTRKVLILNFHFKTLAPLALFNRLFRPANLSPYPLSEKELRLELAGIPEVELCAIRRMSFYERSSALVILRKK